MNKNTDHIPPRWARRFLEWVCPPSLYEGIEGDLQEQFKADVKAVHVQQARRRFVWNMLRFFRTEIIIRNKFSIQLTGTIMIGNYLKIASRNILKRKLYSFINAFGLSIGIAFCILIYLFIQDEKSFDQFHANKNQIYRMEAKGNSKNPSRRDAALQLGLRNVLKEEVPQIKYATRFNTGRTVVLQYRDKIFSEKIAYVDGDFFKMFSF